MLLLWHLKSYLPAHSILRGFVALHLCDFADAIRAGCAEAKSIFSLIVMQGGVMQSVRGVLRQSWRRTRSRRCRRDAIRAGCSETNGRALYSNDHVQNNEINRKESYPIQSSNQIALFYESWKLLLNRCHSREQNPKNSAIASLFGGRTLFPL